MPINTEKNVRITFTTEKTTLEKIKKMQRETSIFNRSELIRNLVEFAIENKKPF